MLLTRRSVMKYSSPSNDTLLRPIILMVYQANNVVVEDIQMVNGPSWFNLVSDPCNIS